MFSSAANLGADNLTDLTEPLDAPKFYEAYGRLLSAMAKLENALTQKMSTLIRQHEPAASLILRGRPRGATSDMIALVDCFKGLPELQPYLDRANDFQKAFDQMTYVRNVLVHGEITSFSNTVPLSAKFAKTQIKQDALHGAEAEWSVDALVEMEGMTYELLSRLDELAQLFSKLSEPPEI